MRMVFAVKLALPPSQKGKWNAKTLSLIVSRYLRRGIAVISIIKIFALQLVAYANDNL